MSDQNEVNMYLAGHPEIQDESDIPDCSPIDPDRKPVEQVEPIHSLAFILHNWIDQGYPLKPTEERIVIEHIRTLTADRDRLKECIVMNGTELTKTEQQRDDFYDSWQNACKVITRYATALREIAEGLKAFDGQPEIGSLLAPSEILSIARDALEPKVEPK